MIATIRLAQFRNEYLVFARVNENVISRAATIDRGIRYAVRHKPVELP